MTEDARALMAQALETALRAALLRQADPLGWLQHVDASVMPDLLALMEARHLADGAARADSALIAEVLAAVLDRLRSEQEG